jgi:hypothetical protein
MRMADLDPGSPIVSNDGQRVARIRSVGQEYIVATSQRGSALLHIPASAVGNVQDGVVWLNIAARDVPSMGWDVPPRTDDAVDDPSTSELHRHV